MISKTNISFVTEELYGLNILLYCLSFNFGTSFTLYKNGWGEEQRPQSDGKESSRRNKGKDKEGSGAN